MKKVITAIMAALFVFSAAACTPTATQPPASQPPAQESKAPEQTQAPVQTVAPVEPAKVGKIAIVTNTVSQNEEEYRSAQQVQAKYGAENVIHETWPDNFMAEQEQMISVVAKIASDPDVKVLVINQAVPGTNAAVDKLLETRKDMFIVYCTPQENPPDVSTRANLILQPDELAMGKTIPEQAKKLGAKVFVHYSFPRHMSQPLLSGRRDLMKAKCAEIGLEFVDATAPDPTGDAGVTGAQQFILEDVPKMVTKYGKDTAFFSTNCSMQTPLIKATSDQGAIYPQPCCPSPYHGYPAALGITADTEGDIKQVISDTAKVLKDKNVLGRFSTWPVPVAMMFTHGAADYGMAWMKGEVPADSIDVKALQGFMKDYTGVDAELTAYTDTADNKTYDNYLLALMGFLTYSESDIIN